MVNLKEEKFDARACLIGLAEFKELLDSSDELGEKLLLGFFRKRPNLILLMGKFGIEKPELYMDEFNIINEFRSDFAVANIQRNTFVFIEFEGAKKNSIFKKVGKNKGTTRYEYARDFEHGFSQVVDWFYRLNDVAPTSLFIEHFSSDKINYTGYLVVGRQKTSIPNLGYKWKFDWRSKHVLVNGKRVICMTYDELYNQLKEKLAESAVELPDLGLV